MVGKIRILVTICGGITSAAYIWSQKNSKNANSFNHTISSKMKLIAEEEGGEIDLLVAITKGWRGLKNNGKDVPFTPKMANDVYINAPSVSTQIDQFVSVIYFSSMNLSSNLP